MLRELIDSITAEGVTIFTSSGQFVATCFLLLVAEAIYVLFGFGSGLIAIGTLAAIFPELSDAVVLILLVNILPEIWVISGTWRRIRWRGVFLICVGIAIGVPIGTWLLRSTNAVILLTVLGFFLVLAGTGFLTLRRARQVAWPTPLVPIIGTLSGVLSGLFGTGGPPLILFYRLAGVDKGTFRGNMMAIFFVVTVTRLISYGASGLLTAPRLWSAAALLPAVLAGTWLGSRVELKLSEPTFQRLVAIALLIMGLLLVGRGLG